MMRRSRMQEGFSLIEVMITIFILGVGLLGLAGLQARAMNAEAESYSRAKALALAQDMADRINANLVQAKQGAASPYPLAGITSPYKTSTVFGTGHADGVCTDTASFPTIAARDLCEWDMVLKGATESVGGNKVGGLAGIRGCISTTTDAATSTNLTGYVVQVAWSGRGGLGSPASGLNCGAGVIAPESTRRVLSMTVPIAALDQ